MWELDNKAEHQRSDAFELWCWRRLLRVPWTARRSHHSILMEIVLNIHWKDWCWRWNSNTLAIWCEELTHWKRPSCWERLKVGGEGMTEDVIAGWHHRLKWTWVWVHSQSWWGRGWPGVLQSMGVAKSRIRTSDWTDLNWNLEEWHICTMCSINFCWKTEWMILEVR